MRKMGEHFHLTVTQGKMPRLVGSAQDPHNSATEFTLHGHRSSRAAGAAEMGAVGLAAGAQGTELLRLTSSLPVHVKAEDRYFKIARPEDLALLGSGEPPASLSFVEEGGGR
jgi:hypothetical protein